MWLDAFGCALYKYLVFFFISRIQSLTSICSCYFLFMFKVLFAVMCTLSLSMSIVFTCSLGAEFSQVHVLFITGNTPPLKVNLFLLLFSYTYLFGTSTFSPSQPPPLPSLFLPPSSTPWCFILLHTHPKVYCSFLAFRSAAKTVKLGFIPSTSPRIRYYLAAYLEICFFFPCIHCELFTPGHEPLTRHQAAWIFSIHLYH